MLFHLSEVLHSTLDKRRGTWNDPLNPEILEDLISIHLSSFPMSSPDIPLGGSDEQYKE